MAHKEHRTCGTLIYVESISLHALDTGIQSLSPAYTSICQELASFFDQVQLLLHFYAGLASGLSKVCATDLLGLWWLVEQTHWSKVAGHQLSRTYIVTILGTGSILEQIVLSVGASSASVGSDICSLSIWMWVVDAVAVVVDDLRWYPEIRQQVSSWVIGLHVLLSCYWLNLIKVYSFVSIHVYRNTDIERDS